MNEHVLEDEVSLFEVISVSDYIVGDGATMLAGTQLPETIVRCIFSYLI